MAKRICDMIVGTYDELESYTFLTEIDPLDLQTELMGYGIVRCSECDVWMVLDSDDAVHICEDCLEYRDAGDLDRITDGVYDDDPEDEGYQEEEMY